MTARLLLGALVRRTRPEHPGWPAVLGPVLERGRRTRLRPPSVEDAEQWSRALAEDHEQLEPWWPTSTQPWAERTSEAQWRRQVWSELRAARKGFAVPTVIEVDGRVGGELSLSRIDRGQGTAELGAWIASEYCGSSVAQVALRMIVRHAFGPLELRRLVAPVGVGNRAAAFVLARNGFRREGVLRAHMHVGGKLVDHQLWSLLPEDVDWL